MKRRGVVLVAAVVVVVAAAAGAGLLAGRGPDPNRVPAPQAVYERTMSPFCPGLTLAACPSSQAVELRATIAEMVRQGRTNRQIDGFLLASYPHTVIGAPRNFVAWLVPAAALIAGLAAIASVVLKRPRALEEPPPALSADDSARLAADLRRFAQGASE
jgi:cytochrome c-type biogenesis protein CcmH